MGYTLVGYHPRNYTRVSPRVQETALPTVLMLDSLAMGHLCHKGGSAGASRGIGREWVRLRPDTGLSLDLMTRDAADVVSIPQIVINEIMQNPRAVSDSAGEWFEVYNPGSSPVDMDGWIVQDNDYDSVVIVGPLVVAPGAYVVLGNNGDSSTNGGLTVDYAYASFYLSNGADEIVLLMPDSTEIDRVEYDGGPEWPDPSGASMMLVDAALDNNVGAHWQTTPDSLTYGLGDAGTPGTANLPPWTAYAIPEIQGAGTESPHAGEVIRTTGVVIGFSEGNLPSGGNFDGFYLQDSVGDGDPATSDGILVNLGTLSGIDVSVGAEVTVIGVVQESNE